MKNKLTLLTAALFLSLGIYAQAPEAISYQAIARNLAGNPLISSPLTVVYEIRQGAPNGTVVYSETHAVNTNQFGLFTAEIGNGTPISGTFAGITWGSGSFYLYVEVNGDPMGATQLLSVPYALYSKQSLNGPPGANGNNSLATSTPEPAGVNCANGGYLIDVGVDDNGDLTLQALEIDFSYYVCNGIDGAANNNDTSATNEIQTLSISNDTVYLSNGGFIVLPSASGDNWGTDVVNTTGGNISGDGTSGNPLSVTDNDTSATNELELPMVGNTIGDVLKWNGSAWINANDSVDDADNDPNNEIELPATAVLNQVLTWNGSAWVAQNAGAGADNWGSQVVQTSGANLSGNGTAGNPLVVTEGDPSPTNEIQDLTTAGNSINITGGTGTTISAVAPTTGDYLYWNGTNWVGQTVPSGADNWGTQVVQTSGANLSGDGTGGNPLVVTEGDPSPTNEIQTLSFTDPNLSLSNGGGSVNLSSLQGTDSQTLTYVSGTQDLSISNGNSVTLVVDDADNDPNNERITTFSVNGTNDSLVIVEAGVGHAMPLSDLSDGDWTKGAGFLYNNVDDIVVGNNITDNARFHIVKPNTAGFMALKLGNTNQPTREWSFDVQGNGFFSLEAENNGSPYTALYFNETNKHLGVFTASPQQNLHVEGFNSILRLQSTQSTTTANAYIEFGNTITGSFDSKGYIGNTGSGDHLDYNALTFHRFSTQNTERMRLTNAGDLILGNFSAFSQLDVAGQITMRTGATAGYIPVSNANGTMTWTDPSTISTASLWSASAGSIYPTTLTDYVGVGTATPAAPLDVYTNTSGRAGQFVQDFSSAATKYGLYGLAQGAGAGTNYGLSGEATSGAVNVGVRGRGFGGAGNYSGYFDLGDFYIADNLGIGTTTPAEKLHVVGNNSIIAKFDGTTAAGAVVDIDAGATGLQSGVRFLAAGSNQGGIMYDGSTGSILTFVNGAPAGEGIHLNTGTYNVGIGTSTPGDKLDVNGSTRISGNLLVGAIPSIQAKAQVNGTGYSWAFKILGGGSNTPVLGVQTSTGNTIIGNTTATPNAQLEVVNSSASVNATTDGILNVGQSNTTHLTMDGNEIQARSSTSTNTLYLNYWGGNVDIARSAGDEVGIGAAPSVSYKLYVNTANHNRAGQFYNTLSSTGVTYGLYASSVNGNASGESLGLYGRADAQGTYAYGVYGFGTGTATTQYAVYSLGNSYASANWLTSDRRLKKNISDFNGALGKIAQLPVKTYDFDNDTYDFMNLPKVKQYGVMAQDLELVFPEMVMEGHHAIMGKDGNLTDETILIKTVNYDQLIPVLVKGIQEQQQQIEQLKQEIEELKNK